MNSNNNKKPDNNEDSDVDLGLELIDAAKRANLRNILNKINKQETLTAHEVKLLNDFEARFKAEQSGAGRRVVGTQKEVAEYLGRSTRTVSYYKTKGMPVNVDGTYDLDQIDEWVKEQGKKGIGQPHGDPSEEEGTGKHHWDVFYREFRGKREKLLYKQLKGDLILKKLVNELLETRAVEFRRALMEQDRRLALKLAYKDEKECARILKEDRIFILETYSRGHTLSDIMVTENGE